MKELGVEKLRNFLLPSIWPDITFQNKVILGLNQESPWEMVEESLLLS